MRRSGLLLTLASLLLVLFSAARAEACTCMMPGPPCQAFGTASAVFVGTVTDVRTRKAKSVEAARAEPDWWPVVVKFSVVQPFHGVEGAEVEVATGQGGGDCGYQFVRGASYLVYAHGGRDGKTLMASICSRTQPLSQAAEDLEFLRGVGARGPEVSIDITVTRLRHSVKTGSANSLGGLSDARLTIEGAGESREVRTDSGGRARLAGVKPGAYKIKLATPEGLTTHREEQEVTVADRGCASVQYFLSDDGRISGRVTDAEGRTAAGVLVALVEADDPDPVRPNARYVRTGEDGRYELKGLPPGRYLLVVNYTQYPEANDPSNAYPRTYYPGAAQPSQAEAVSIGAGERAKDRDITLPARRGESLVSGVVVWDDGRPVANAQISFRDVTYDDPGLDHDAPPADARGRFTLKGHTGQTLIISAVSDRRFVGDYQRDGPMERAEPLRVTLDGPTERVRIVITKIR